MNDTNDTAFEPMDKPAAVGEKSDGTVTYKIVDGNTYLNNELVEGAKVVGHVQIDEAKAD
jgi:hypothetical protein